MVDDPRSPVVLAFATDEGFAMPTAVAGRSALDTLDQARRVEIYVLGVDLSETTWERLRASWQRPGVTMHRVDGDDRRFSDLPDQKYITRTTYQRFELPEVLSGHDRVLYLDGDVLVRRDVSSLFDIELGGASTAGALDCDLWHLSDEVRGGLARWRELGLDPYGPHINCGVLLISLDAWRADRVPQRALEYLRATEAVRELDQDALNVALAGRWLLLDHRWNVQTQAYWPGFPRQPRPGEPNPFPWSVVRQIRRDPWIVHFTTKEKPWSELCRHPLQREWAAVHARTAWADEHVPDVSDIRRLVRRARWTMAAARRRYLPAAR